MSSGIVNPNPKKPIGRKNYGSIGHLPCSRLGPGDHSIEAGQARICTEKARDRLDRIIVQEKLDGSNVGAARVHGELIALGRAGYRAGTSPHKQHHMFASWLTKNAARFNWLQEGWRVCGEWMAQAHGTRYTLPRGPFIAFDMMRGSVRSPEDNIPLSAYACIPWATTIHDGGPIRVQDAMSLIGEAGFDGALDAPEGVVYRVERKGKVDFLAKYVRPDKVDGLYLPGVSGKPAVWNWES